MRSPRRAARGEEQPETAEHGAAATQEASKTLPAVDCRSPRAKGVNPMHFRSRTLSSPADYSGELLLQATAPPPGTMEEEVESLHRALAESREEAQLAARIGQTLLERNQQMDAEIERQDIALSVRAEQAEHEARNLEKKLSSAHMQLRLLEIARTKAADQAEQMLDELECSRLRNQALQGELNKARDEARGLLAAKRTAEEVSERMRGELARLQAAHLRAEEDAAKLARRLSETMAAEQEQIALLEDENTKLKQKNKTVELREAALQTQNTQTRAALAAEQSATQEQLARTTQLDEMIEQLSQELDDVKDALRQEQLCVAQLHDKTRELEEQLNSSERVDEERPDSETTSPSSSRRMRAGSLFFELSRELSADMKAADIRRDSSTRCDHRDHRDVGTSPRSSDDSGASTSSWDASGVACSPTARSPEHNLLKEFFMLTAAAVKISGAGLGNDACNIHNETLYEEAMRQDVTFDQYHKWLERRLDGAPVRVDDRSTRKLSV